MDIEMLPSGRGAAAGKVVKSGAAAKPAGAPKPAGAGTEIDLRTLNNPQDLQATIAVRGTAGLEPAQTAKCRAVCLPYLWWTSHNRLHGFVIIRPQPDSADQRWILPLANR